MLGFGLFGNTSLAIEVKMELSVVMVPCAIERNSTDESASNNVFMNHNAYQKVIVRAKQAIKVTFLVMLGILVAGIAFLVDASLADQVETSRVEAAIKRDCSVDLEVDPQEIAEPGIVFEDYEINGTPMSLICYGANNWSCTCTRASPATPIPND